MANIKSQIKRAKTNDAKRAQNTSFKSSLKTAVKAVVKAVETGNKEEAVVALNSVNAKLDKSVSKGIHHKNYAARQKSRLAKLVNSISA